MQLFLFDLFDFDHEGWRCINNFTVIVSPFLFFTLQFCPFGHSLWKWNSQPLLKFGMQGGDFMLSTNILLSGNNYRKIALLFQFMKMGMVAHSTFFKIQDTYCVDPIEKFWERNRADVLTRLRQKDRVVVLGKWCFIEQEQEMFYNLVIMITLTCLWSAMKVKYIIWYVQL